MTNNGSGGQSNVISGSGPFVLNPGSPFTYTVDYQATATDQDTFLVPITGTGGLEHLGTGSLFLYGNNTYSGGTLLGTTAGVNFNNANSFGTGPITWGVSGTILATVASDGAGNTGATAPITIANQVNTISGSQIFVGTAAAPVTFSGPWHLPSSGTTIFDPTPAAANVTFTGVISGSAAFENQGAGSIYLWGNNTYSGGTVLDTTSGLNFNNNNSFGTGAITWGESGTVLATPATDGSGNATGASGPITIPNAVKCDITASATHADICRSCRRTCDLQRSLDNS